MIKSIFLYFLIFICSALLSCENNDSNNDSNSESVIFETTLLITDSVGNESSIFTQGETITFIINFKNLTRESQTMGFSSGQHYDIEVYNSEETLIWNWARDKAFIQVQTELVFGPNEIKTYEETWNQTSNEGTPVAVETYSVYANSAGPYYLEIE